MRVLFYAINHIGLGHVARLSIVQRYLSERKLAECHFFSESRHAAAFFSCPGVLLDGEQVSGRARWRLLEAGISRAIDDLRPDILVCDTYWSEARASIPRLTARGGRAVLMLRMTDTGRMAMLLREALPMFDAILLPHHPCEIRRSCREAPELLQALDSPRVVPVGPLCRTSTRPARAEEVIFSLGAGGEWPQASKANLVSTFLEAFVGASRRLKAQGAAKPSLAAGSVLQLTPAIEAAFRMRRTMSLYKHFGPRTTVVTRGGYNTIWETVAARGRLIVCGTRNQIDDVKGRSEFVQREGLGRSIFPEADAVFDAIATPWETDRPEVDRWASFVNAGLPVVADEILGGSVLRAMEPIREYPASDSQVLMGSASKRLIVRFEDVDPARPSPAVKTAARLAMELGYETRLCDARAKDDDCVSVLAWPGPRVRNELRISEEIADRRKRGVNTGLSVHADRMPLFLVEYLLRAFALYNR